MTERYHYWSNGTEGMLWAEHWCWRCENDHFASHGPDMDPADPRGCAIYTRTMTEDDHRTIPELVEPGDDCEPGRLWDVTCLAFAPCRWCDEDSDDPPAPVVPIPGQFTIFDFELAEVPA